MGYLEYHERVSLRCPTLLMAFAGWSDAAEGATGALKYLVRKLPTRRLASIDPEEFYDFTHVRPMTRVDAQGQREVTWPANEFYGCSWGGKEEGLLIFTGVEPNLKWRTFANLLADVAQEHGVAQAIMLGALLDAVPHTRPIRISGGSSSADLQEKLQALTARTSSYQGPTGISSAVSQVFLSRGIRFGSMWGHAPHYLQVDNYPKVSLALLERLEDLMDTRFDLEEMRVTQEDFERQFQQLLHREEEVMAYVQRLERQYDASDQQQGPTPTPQEMVRALEEFLKRRRAQGEGTPPP